MRSWRRRLYLVRSDKKVTRHQPEKSLRRKIRQLTYKHPTSFWTKLVVETHWRFYHLLLFFATLTGYIPMHSIRLLLYRSVFGVDIPKDSVIYWRCRFFAPSGVHIGHHSIVGNDAFLDGRAGIHVGDNVNIGSQVLIYTMEHDINSPTFGVVAGPVLIGNMVYIGARVTILPEVKIGSGAVVASGAVVTKDVEPWTVVAGVPAKFIKRRPELSYRLDTSSKKAFFQ